MLNGQEVKKLREKKRELLETKQYDELEELEQKFHHKTHGAYIGDVIFAANDGLVTTFAVVAGAAGGGLTAAVVLILGFANLVADGLAMGFGNYLGSKSERQYAALQRKKEKWEIEKMPDIERLEVERTFSEWGFSKPQAQAAAKTITADKTRWVDFMLRNEHDITVDPEGSPIAHGSVTFFAFAIAGVLPLVAYLLPISPTLTLPLSISITAISLFTIGACRTFVTAQNWFKSGLEMLMVGSIAAIVAFFIGNFIEHLVTSL